MSIATLILGESGTGKTTSLRNLDPRGCMLIQPTRKPLPFRSNHWIPFNPKNPSGFFNIIYEPNPQGIATAMQKANREVIIIDDFQYVLCTLFMQRRWEGGWDKFNQIGGVAYDIFKMASELGYNQRVYIMSHIQESESGKSKMMTIGKMTDNFIKPEGWVIASLQTHVDSGKYMFSTHNSGNDTVKTPMGMFEEMFIPNDLALVDRRIVDFYQLSSPMYGVRDSNQNQEFEPQSA